mmetsp:Transcript_19243/g.38819  ORF Transcript_19243/g.38819 Transcript_19243/m.38819 type:complete len:227 (+) Transcript_19243:1286-1966(+)|eukprot:CAMPEP_0178689816 /NCGR_PEP_ID=MMETSP0699-20121125/5744_1 /TAXON_ID=265572 /ORGANISM="Extubocellulus spinifer, Strain CCMP396" /LENGTH=226 /DNA_ID=CAMNT_0020334913 /DNA_START=1982 /DNA_END=2662 /DNA_ORIENTATION=+
MPRGDQHIQSLFSIDRSPSLSMKPLDEDVATASPSVLAREQQVPGNEVAPDVSQVYERLEDAHTSWEMMGCLFDDVGKYVISQRLRVAKEATRKRFLERSNAATAAAATAGAHTAAAQPATKRARKCAVESSRIKTTIPSGDPSRTPPKGQEDEKIPPTNPSSESDAEKIRRMARIYIHLRKAHAMFLREIDSTMQELISNAEDNDVEGEDAPAENDALGDDAPTE